MIYQRPAFYEGWPFLIFIALEMLLGNGSTKHVNFIAPVGASFMTPAVDQSGVMNDAPTFISMCFTCFLY